MHKVLDDAFGSLHKACSVQQGTHQGVWQLMHFAAPRSSDCQQSYTKHVIQEGPIGNFLQIQSKIGQMSPTTRHRQAAAEEGLPWYI